MSSGNHKFQDTFEITYEDYVNSLYSELILLIKELQNKQEKLQTNAIMKPFFIQNSIEWAKKEAINHPIESLADFVEYDNTAFQSNLTVSEVKEATENRYLSYVTECLIAKLFREMDASDIGYDFVCATDFTNAPHYNPNLKLTRKMTLMQGHPYCDFLYTWEEE